MSCHKKYFLFHFCLMTNLIKVKNITVFQTDNYKNYIIAFKVKYEIYFNH